MKKPATFYYEGRLQQLCKALEKNNFQAYSVPDAASAKKLVINELLPELKKTENIQSLSFGGSMTLVYAGIYHAIKDGEQEQCKNLKVLDTFDTSLSPEEAIALRRQSLLTDVYLTGSNAITEDGRLINLDGIGNRVAALTFGPKHVIVVAGRNKIVNNTHAAFHRVRNHAAPINALRLDRKTPCTKTFICENCSASDRICSTWTITEKSWPKHRVKVVLINEDMGF